ncbi:MAG: hypothetical protein SO532_01625, partial [Candidatus Borkfalkiaceae bacterium]|nr:hypothetical protein [Christensenellaceae bacterium]
AWEAEKAAYEKEKAKNEEETAQTINAVREQSASLTRREAALKDKEYELEGRETALNEARRQFNAARIAAEYASLTGAPSAYAAQPAQAQQAPASAQNAYGGNAYATDHANAGANRNAYDFSMLNERAQADGIKLRTAGNAATNLPNGRASSNEPTIANVAANDKNASFGFFNKGKTLFKAALVIFFIALAESISVFFFRNELGVNGLYPFVAFTGGFLTFLVCTIMYAGGYKPKVRKTKKCGYILTSFVVFVIVTVLASMVAVYLKVDLRSTAVLFAYVLLPVIYLFNVVLFALFYRLFSKTTNAD